MLMEDPKKGVINEVSVATTSAARLMPVSTLSAIEMVIHAFFPINLLSPTRLRTARTRIRSTQSPPRTGTLYPVEPVKNTVLPHVASDEEKALMAIHPICSELGIEAFSLSGVKMYLRGTRFWCQEAWAKNRRPNGLDGSCP
jgi:hypothetical protein